ncbi:MAG: glutamate 5-kinase [Gammaproteobacteria bacterium]|nr:glutamate 5-kinase [Gammaproteobacteria bacterium]|tara:strand:- start:1359 stop:2135 length:777 start_codon:yes stop_codon:yes gene_type:complete
MRKNLDNCKRIIIKIGSSLISQDKSLSIKKIEEWTEQINKIKEKDKQIIIVSSGAISQGMNILNMKEKPQNLESLQALAAIGQQQLIGMYENAFKKFNIKTAQVLLTHDDIANKEKYNNARATLEKILDLDVIPIINENDVVATEEIRFGDNDNLAAMVANLIKVDLLIILTDQNGYYDKNPTIDTNAKLIDNCKISDLIIENNLETTNQFGTGGFKTKLQAVKRASDSNTITIVASGLQQQVLLKIFNGDNIGTLFE